MPTILDMHHGNRQRYRYDQPQQRGQRQSYPAEQRVGDERGTEIRGQEHPHGDAETQCHIGDVAGQISVPVVIGNPMQATAKGAVAGMDTVGSYRAAGFWVGLRISTAQATVTTATTTSPASDNTRWSGSLVRVATASEDNDSPAW